MSWVSKGFKVAANLIFQFSGFCQVLSSEVVKRRKKNVVDLSLGV
jgi:hypothetical protein